MVSLVDIVSAGKSKKKYIIQLARNKMAKLGWPVGPLVKPPLLGDF